MRDELLSDEELWDKYKGPDSHDRRISNFIVQPLVMGNKHIQVVNRIVGINRISEAGPVDKFWPVVFLEGCNMRCPYCLNASIIDQSKLREHIPIKTITDKLDEWGEEGVMLSGGEVLKPQENFDIVDVIKELSGGCRRVGISTNGTYPDALKKLIASGLISFVAIDYKLCPSSSAEELTKRINIMSGYPDIHCDIKQSVSHVFEWHEHCITADSEIRVTLYPEVIDQDDVIIAAAAVHKNSTFVLQQYRRNILSDGTENPVLPYSDETVAEMYRMACQVCDGNVQMRYP